MLAFRSLASSRFGPISTVPLQFVFTCPEITCHARGQSCWPRMPTNRYKQLRLSTSISVRKSQSSMFARSLTRTLISTSLRTTRITLSTNSHCVPPIFSRSAMSFPYKPNTEPPKDMTVFRNLAGISSQSEKFRRVLWTGRNSQVQIVSLFVIRALTDMSWHLACHYDYPRGRGDRGSECPNMPVYICVLPTTPKQEIHTVDQHLTFHSGSADAIVNGKTVRLVILTSSRDCKIS